jgi:lactoylglutathione lyase
MHISYAMVFVSDMARSVAFYRDVLGLPLRFESPGWSEFETGAATLALHAAVAPGSGMADPVDLPAGRCRPGFAVADLDAFHARMTEKAVTCVQPPTAVYGSRVAQYVDPDGLMFSVGEERHGR